MQEEYLLGVKHLVHRLRGFLYWPATKSKAMLQDVEELPTSWVHQPE